MVAFQEFCLLMIQWLQRDMRVQSQEGCSLVCERSPDVVKLISVALIDIDIAINNNDL